MTNEDPNTEMAGVVATLGGEQPFAGKRALVVGGTGSIGSAIAASLGALGADVAVHYRSDDSRATADELVETIRSDETDALALQADIARPGEVESVFRSARDAFGGLDFCINTAGVMLKAPVADVSEAEFDRVFDVHAKGGFFCLREAARQLDDGGRVVTLSTALADTATPEYATYAGAKAAVEQFTRRLAVELADRGVTVNAVAPGPIDNSYLRVVETEADVERIESMTPAGRLGTVDDIVPFVLFLCSESAGWITGETIRPDGGLSG